MELKFKMYKLKKGDKLYNSKQLETKNRCQTNEQTHNRRSP